MRCVVQRVTRARVDVAGELVNKIDKGYMVLAGVGDGDGMEDVDYCAGKIAGLRVFEDEQGKMNRSVVEVGGGILLISQFTLMGDARHGRRPSFSAAARPDTAAPLVDRLRDKLIEMGIPTYTGIFGADMQVELVNDGPVTILLDSKRLF